MEVEAFDLDKVWRCNGQDLGAIGHADRTEVKALDLDKVGGVVGAVSGKLVSTIGSVDGTDV